MKAVFHLGLNSLKILSSTLYMRMLNLQEVNKPAQYHRANIGCQLDFKTRSVCKACVHSITHKYFYYISTVLFNCLL